jgi:hypothetical protein
MSTEILSAKGATTTPIKVLGRESAQILCTSGSFNGSAYLQIQANGREWINQRQIVGTIQFTTDGPGVYRVQIVEYTSGTLTVSQELNDDILFSVRRENGDTPFYVTRLGPAFPPTSDDSDAGMVPRPIREKLLETISVKDFGAVGDGVTDDTSKVAAADAAVAAIGGGTVVFPGGPYNFTGQPDPGVTWRFSGAPVQRTLLGGGANFEATSASYTYLSGPHPTFQKTAEYIRVLVQGSEQIGQSFCDAALNLHIQKEHWSETTGTPKAGEIDGLCITYRQGGPRVGGGDPLAGISSGAAILCNAQATQASGATQILEAVNSVVDVPGLAVNRQIGIQIGMLNTRDGDYYGNVVISTTGTQSAAFYAISQSPSTWTNVLMSRVGSYVPYFISVLGRSRWQTVAGVNASLEQEDPSGDLVFKNNGGTEIFRVGQTRTTATPNTARVAATTSESISQADHQRIVVLANAAAITCTLSATAAVGTTVRAIQRDAGQVTFTPSGGATLNNRSGHTKTAGQYAAVTLEVRANGGGSAAIWVLSGDTAA